MSVIQVENLTKVYKTYRRGSGLGEVFKSLFKREEVVVRAVDGVSFDIAEGEICGILGPNGAGKSTTIKCLSGALFPTEGSIGVMGYDPARDRKRYTREIGAVFGQKSQLVFDIPPLDSFRMNKAIYGIDDASFERTLNELVSLFEVQSVMKRPTRVLSLGERMKCEFIMAMLHRPKIVFLDEPTIGLDVIAKAKIRGFIREMNKNGTTFILTTHDLEDVEALAGRVIIINTGKKVFDGALKDLRQTLGEKKIVDIRLLAPIDGELENAAVIHRKSDLELTLEVDVADGGISRFIEQISGRVLFSDISIRELPMERVITKLYESEGGSGR